MSNIQIVRDTRLWVSTQTGSNPSYTPANTWEIEVQDDFSFSQDNNTSDITVEEAGDTPTRGGKRFNDSLNPADWSFSTYLRPFDSTPAAGITSPEAVMWHALASSSVFDLTKKEGASSNATNMLVSFEDNAAHVLMKVDLIFLVDTVWYKITDCQVGSAGISVDIGDLGMVAWSGQGRTLTPLAVAPFDPITDTTVYTTEAINADYIENKLTSLVLINNDTSKSYKVPITGGSIDINNNVTYLTPNTLSRLDAPVASYTGNFDVTGSIEAYLSTATLGTATLLQDMLTTNSVTNSFTLGICMGGQHTSESPGVVIVLPNAHISLPTVSTGDVLSTTIDFKGIPTELSAGDEVFIGMSPKYTKTSITKLISTGDGAP